jgi:putative ABC transport system permease protein
MFTHYITVMLRGILKHKAYSLITIAGLAVGMACCILILLYVQDEVVVDRFHAQGDRIYRVVIARNSAERTSVEISSPPPLGPALATDFSQVAHTVRFLNANNPVPLICAGGKQIYENQFCFVDPAVFDVFTIPLLQGDAKTALQKPNTIVISETIAKKYFGDQNAVGKTITLNNTLTLEVTGVTRDTPSTSTLNFNFLASFASLPVWLGNGFVDNWHNNSCQTYVLLADNTSTDQVSHQFPLFIQKYLGNTSSIQQMYLQPLNRIHLYSYQDFGLTSTGDIQYVYLLSTVALFVLFIACINFVNLTTARSMIRSREIGIRKLVGATRTQLMQQFVGEGVVLTAIALAAAIVMVCLVIPYFNLIVDKELAVDVVRNRGLQLGLVVIAVLVGIVSSAYPAFILSSMRLIDILRGTASTAANKMTLRKILVMIQFTLTIILMSGTWIVSSQLRLMQNRKVGFDKEHVIVVPIRSERLRQDPEPLKARLLAQPGVLQVGAAALLPGGPVGKTRFSAHEQKGGMDMLWVDQDFISTLDIQLSAGRMFSKSFATDASEGFIINEEAVSQLGWRSPEEAVGQPFEVVDGKKGHIIGVVKNFNVGTLQRRIGPVVLQIWPWMNYLVIRYDERRLPAALEGLRTAWQEFDADNPVAYTFLRDRFDRFVRSEERLGQILGYFTFLAILIASLGLFSLAALTTEQRTKEIGIRKVLGASVPELIVLLSKEFALWVLVANLLAWPVAYYTMNNWLEDYAYRITMTPWIFLCSGFAALLIAIVTVGVHVMKAATANPIDALRYE